jgi:hypothetical protein
MYRNAQKIVLLASSLLGVCPFQESPLFRCNDTISCVITSCDDAVASGFCMASAFPALSQCGVKDRSNNTLRHGDVIMISYLTLHSEVVIK